MESYCNCTRIKPTRHILNFITKTVKVKCHVNKLVREPHNCSNYNDATIKQKCCIFFGEDTYPDGTIEQVYLIHEVGDKGWLVSGGYMWYGWGLMGGGSCIGRSS